MTGSEIEIQAGDVGFSTIGGRIGWWVNLGQALLRDGSRYTHTWISVGDGRVVEAMPAGARMVTDADRLRGDVVWIRLPLDDVQRRKVALYARARVGTPYSFLDYLALAMREWRIPGHQFLRGYVQSSGRMICSQLVDHVLTESGYHLFSDGRWPQDVTPGGLFYRVLRMGYALPIGDNVEAAR